MTLLRRFKYFLWYFGHFKVPLIGYLKPRLITLDDKQVVVMIPLSRRSKNHLNSMYFGALSIGADLAGGLHGFYYADKTGLKISLVFKTFQAQFLKRPESNVWFVGETGETVRTMLEESQRTGQRINKMINIKAFIHYPDNPEEVANFLLELSIKVA